MTAFPHRSLTLRLTALFAAASTALLICIGYVFGTSMDVHFLHEDATELQGRTELVRHLLAKLRADGDLALLQERLQDALVGQQALFVSIRDSKGDLLFASPGDLFPIDQLAQTSGMQMVHGLPITTDTVAGHHYRITRTLLPIDFPTTPHVQLTMGLNIDHHFAFIEAVRRTVWVAVAIGALLSGVLGWVAARVGLAPLRAFATLTARISANRLHARVTTEHLPPELTELGKSFNDMLSRLEDSFRRLNEFSSDLAHELRTPISNLTTQSQVALSRSRTADEYREVIYSAIEEYERLARMITDMLFLARADNGLLIPAQEDVDLRAETQALFDFYDALVEAQDVRLVVAGQARVPGDRIMLRRALGNLLSNAIRHSPRGSTVSVQLSHAGPAHIAITVSNPGAPIAPEHLPRLFDRFYRADPARQHTGEGAGLGLAITRTIIAAHGGTISVRSDARATCFEIRLPADHAPAAPKQPALH